MALLQTFLLKKKEHVPLTPCLPLSSAVHLAVPAKVERESATVLTFPFPPQKSIKNRQRMSKFLEKIQSGEFTGSFFSSALLLLSNCICDEIHDTSSPETAPHGRRRREGRTESRFDRDILGFRWEIWRGLRVNTSRSQKLCRTQFC